MFHIIDTQMYVPHHRYTNVCSTTPKYIRTHYFCNRGKPLHTSTMQWFYIVTTRYIYIVTTRFPTKTYVRLSFAYSVCACLCACDFALVCEWVWVWVWDSPPSPTSPPYLPLAYELVGQLLSHLDAVSIISRCKSISSKYTAASSCLASPPWSHL